MIPNFRRGPRCNVNWGTTWLEWIYWHSKMSRWQQSDIMQNLTLFSDNLQSLADTNAKKSTCLSAVLIVSMLAGLCHIVIPNCTLNVRFEQQYISHLLSKIFLLLFKSLITNYLILILKFISNCYSQLPVWCQILFGVHFSPHVKNATVAVNFDIKTIFVWAMVNSFIKNDAAKWTAASLALVCGHTCVLNFWFWSTVRYLRT